MGNDSAAAATAATKESDAAAAAPLPSNDSSLCQRVRDECERLWSTMELKDSSFFKINSVPDSNTVELVVVVVDGGGCEGSQNKQTKNNSTNNNNDSEEGHATIRLLVGPMYPDTVPDISFSVLPNNSSNKDCAAAAAINYSRNVFLKKIMDRRLESITEIVSFWFDELCSSCHGSSRGSTSSRDHHPHHHHSLCEPSSQQTSFV